MDKHVDSLEEKSDSFLSFWLDLPAIQTGFSPRKSPLYAIIFRSPFPLPVPDRGKSQLANQS